MERIDCQLDWKSTLIVPLTFSQTRHWAEQKALSRLIWISPRSVNHHYLSGRIFFRSPPASPDFLSLLMPLLCLFDDEGRECAHVYTHLRRREKNFRKTNCWKKKKWYREKECIQPPRWRGEKKAKEKNRSTRIRTMNTQTFLKKKYVDGINYWSWELTTSAKKNEGRGEEVKQEIRKSIDSGRRKWLHMKECAFSWLTKPRCFCSLASIDVRNTNGNVLFIVMLAM